MTALREVMLNNDDGEHAATGQATRRRTLHGETSPEGLPLLEKVKAAVWNTVQSQWPMAVVISCRV